MRFCFSANSITLSYSVVARVSKKREDDAVPRMQSVDYAWTLSTSILMVINKSLRIKIENTWAGQWQRMYVWRVRGEDARSAHMVVVGRGVSEPDMYIALRRKA